MQVFGVLAILTSQSRVGQSQEYYSEISKIIMTHTAANVEWRQVPEQTTLNITMPVLLSPSHGSKDISVTVKDKQVLVVKVGPNTEWECMLHDFIEDEVNWTFDKNKYELTMDITKCDDRTWPGLLATPLKDDDSHLLSRAELDSRIARELPSLPPVGATSAEEDEAMSNPQIAAELHGIDLEIVDIKTKLAEMSETVKVTQEGSEDRKILDKSIESATRMLELLREMRSLRSETPTIDNFLKVQVADIQKARANIGSMGPCEMEEFKDDDERQMTGTQLYQAAVEILLEDPAPAVHLFRLASIHHQHGPSTVALFGIYANSSSYPRGASLLLQNALRGEGQNVVACTNAQVGKLFTFSARHFPPIFALAVYFNQRAAIVGDAQAMIGLAKLFFCGECTNDETMTDSLKKLNMDVNRANYFLNCALERGSIEAYLIRAAQHIEGTGGVPQSIDKARKFYERAVAAEPSLVARISSKGQHIGLTRITVADLEKRLNAVKYANIQLNESTFAKILANLVSPDLAIRSEASAQFISAKVSNGPWVLQALSHIAAHEAPLQIHLTTFKLLQELFDVSDKGGNCIFSTLQPTIKEEIKNNLEVSFSRFGCQKALSVAVGPCIFSCAAKVFRTNEEDQWDTLFDKLIETLSSDNAPTFQRVIACELLGDCTPVLSVYLSTKEETLPLLTRGLISCLEGDGNDDDDSVKLKITAGETFARLLKAIDFPPEIHSTFRPFVQNMLKVIAREWKMVGDGSTDNDETLHSLLEIFSNFVVLCPSLVAEASVLEFFMNMSTKESLKFELKRGACMMLVKFADIIAAVVKVVPNFPKTLLDALFGVMLSDNEENEVEFSFEDLGSTGLIINKIVPRLQKLVAASKKCYTSFASHAQFLVTDNIKSDLWENRRAALNILVVCIRPLCEMFKEDMIDTLVKLVAPLIKDTNEKVRFAALQCLNEMALRLGSEMQLGQHKVIVPALCTALVDPSQHVKQAAAIAIQSYFGFDKKKDNTEEESDDQKDENENNEEENSEDTNKAIANALRPYAAKIEEVLLDVLSLDPTDENIASAFLKAFTTVVRTTQTVSKKCLPTFIEVFDGIASKAHFSPKEEKITVDELAKNLPEKERLNRLYFSVISASAVLVKTDIQHFRPYTNRLHKAMKEFVPDLIEGLLKSKNYRDLLSVLEVVGGIVEALEIEVFPSIPVLVPCFLAVAKNETPTDKDLDNDEEIDVVDVQIMCQGQALKIILAVVDLEGNLGKSRSAIQETASSLLFHGDPRIRIIASCILGRLAAAFKLTPDEAPAFVSDAISSFNLALRMSSNPDDFNPSCVEGNAEGISLIVQDFAELIPSHQLKTLATTLCCVITQTARYANFLAEIKKKNEEATRKTEGSTEDVEEDGSEEPSQTETLLSRVFQVVYILLERCPLFKSLFEDHFFPVVFDVVLKCKDHDFISGGLDLLALYFEHLPNHQPANFDLKTILLHLFSGANETNPYVAHSAFNGLRTLLTVADYLEISSEEIIQLARQIHEKVMLCLERPSSRAPSFATALTNAVSAGLLVIEKFPNALDVHQQYTFLTTVVGHLPLGGEDTGELESVNERLSTMLKAQNLQTQN